MPGGTYRLEGGVRGGVEERFSCAPDGGGWRYSATRSDGGTVELTTDGRWRPARLQITSGPHMLRGGAAGPELLWVTAGREHAARAAGFAGDSPGLLVAVARSLRLRDGESVDAPVLEVSGTGGGPLAVRTVPRRWRRAETVWHEADGARLPVERYEITDLETGELSELHLAGDVVVAASGVELLDLDGPPDLGNLSDDGDPG